MNLFAAELEIEVGKVGFDSRDANGQPLDLLGRKETGERLSELVERFSEPLVIALDGEWGSGKSHFLKLWAGAHTIENGGTAKVIYFDAFAHDYLDDPLVSLVARLVHEQGDKGLGKRAMERLKNAAFPLAKLATRVGLAALTGGATEILGAAGDEAAKKIGGLADDEVAKFWQAEQSKIAAMEGFREALRELTTDANGTPRKIIFIIDELDRCRPDYALSLLEIIKHFFAVKNVHFVLGVNQTALQHSVRARYGFDEVMGTKYLQKFVSLTLNLPRLDKHHSDVTITQKYYDALVAKFIKSNDLKTLMDEYLRQIFPQKSLTIRDVQRLLTVIALLSNQQENLAFGYRAMLVGAAFIKVLHPEVYNKLRKNTAQLEEIATSLNMTPWRDHASGSSPVRLWIVWSMIVSPDALKENSILADDIERYKKVFSPEWGDPFSWRDADSLLAAAFDTFTLPPPSP